MFKYAIDINNSRKEPLAVLTAEDRKFNYSKGNEWQHVYLRPPLVVAISFNNP